MDDNFPYHGAAIRRAAQAARSRENATDRHDCGGGEAMRVAAELRRRLERALLPERLEIEDQSARHAGHGGARPEGETHFRVIISSPLFVGRNRLECQRLVYEAAGDLLRT